MKYFSPISIGTRSVLFGVHQFILHPFFVYCAWGRIYGKSPTLKESICIFFHDIGYMGKPNMDGDEGKDHPALGGKIVNYFLGKEYANLSRYHSRSYALKYGKDNSKLALPDKLSTLLYPAWLYLFLGELSGEITEYKCRMGMQHLNNHEWLEETKNIVFKWARNNSNEEQCLRLHLYFEDKLFSSLSYDKIY